MFARYNIELTQNDWNNVRNEIDRYTVWRTINEIEQVVHERLDMYLISEGDLSASAIETDWFPQIESHVFISHSRADQAIATKLASILKDSFGINSFVDSIVWGYADNLLKSIDDTYCRNQNGKTYNYAKRNKSTAHVHMILQSALAKMMDRSECVLFLNTPNSININELDHEETTSSPWLYNELLMANILRIQIPSRYHQKKVASDGIESFSTREISFKYNPILEGLVSINLSDFLSILNEKKHSSPEEYLDYLYSKKTINNRT